MSARDGNGAVPVTASTRRRLPQKGTAPPGTEPGGAVRVRRRGRDADGAGARQALSAARALFSVADGRMTAAAFAGSGW
ncbi:hypothetical protein GCM10010361_49560 [Streptomyces olivaceiscleroticus]|uniref:Uncharacterized protein n=1 Tax=Streptomyces olivaceiscleroticus TaxID=68245 RepID=A0ABP3KG69_9ACTN